MERSVGSLWEAGERGTVTEEVEHLSSTAKPTPLISSLSSQTYVPVSTPRLMSPSIGAYPYSGEEPFLDTAPSSPVPRRTHTHDSFSNGLEDVEVFDEGDRVGVGVWLEGRGGWARDCFGDSRDGTEPGNGIGGPGELEIVRRLGRGDLRHVSRHHFKYNMTIADDRVTVSTSCEKSCTIQIRMRTTRSLPSTRTRHSRPTTTTTTHRANLCVR